MTAKRRSHGDHGLYFDQARNRWTASVELDAPDGKRARKVVRGKTKTEVKNKLKKLADELETGVRTSGTYTVSLALDDWLASLRGKSAATVTNYTHIAAHFRPYLGTILLKDLTARDVAAALTKIAPEVSARTLRLVHQTLERAIRHAEINDLVGRNVASLIKLSDLVVAGKPGRPSKSLTLGQAVAVLHAAARSRLYAYVVLSLACGARTEEPRAVTWADLDLEEGVLSVVRSVRDAGKLKTIKSHRRLALPALAVTALRAHKLAQARMRRKAAELWQENDLVFCSEVGTALDHHNVRRAFVKITEAAGIGSGWTPLELRHSFVSILSGDGTSIEKISHLMGHNGTAVTEGVYRHDVAVLSDHVEPVDRLLGEAS